MINKTKGSVAAILAMLMISGCGGTHFGTDPDEFRYEAPELVSEADEVMCTSRARSAARQRGNELTSSKSMENTAMYGGVIGAVGVFSYIYEAEEQAYEEAFQACLEERGYELN